MKLKRRADPLSVSVPAKRQKSDTMLLDFHINLLLKLLQDKVELRDAVLLLQQSIKIMRAGGKSQMTLWHLKRVKTMAANDPEIAEAIDMLSDCVEYRDALDT